MASPSQPHPTASTPPSPSRPPASPPGGPGLSLDVLATQWRAETAAVASPRARRAHPTYRAIVARGKAALPWLLGRVRAGEAHWDGALREILGDGPEIAREDWGRHDALCAAWDTWARTHEIR